MDWRYLFTSFEGRIGRQQFWMGAIVLFAAGVVLSIVIVGALGGNVVTSVFNAADGQADPGELMRLNTISGWGNLVVFLILVAPVLALALKRRHDRGSDGKLVWVWSGFSFLGILLQLTGIGYGVQNIGGITMVTPNFLGSIVGLVSGILGIYLLVVLGFLKGDTGGNAYGPDPLMQG